MFGNQPLQQQPVQQLQQSTANNSAQQFAETVVALTRPRFWGDERDEIIWNMNKLLAMSGCGKGFHHAFPMPIEFTLENSYCRFKAVGYNRLGGHKNEDGLLAFILKKNANDVSNMRQLFIDGIARIMGKPNLSLVIDNIRPLPSDANTERCEVTAYILESSTMSDAKRRIPALESYNYFAQAAMKARLEQELQVADLAPKVDPPLDKLEEHLALPMQGIDRAIWLQALHDNPDPSKLIPWPILGFSKLRERQVMQQQEAARQSSDMRELLQKIEGIEQKTLTSQSRLAELKAAEDRLSHRVLKIVGTIFRRSREGHAFDSNEELLHSRLESVFLSLNGPLQIKGRLSELLSQLRNRNYVVLENTIVPRAPDGSDLTSTFVDDTKLHLKKFQDGLEKLVNVIQNDLKDLDVIDDSIKNRLEPRK